MDQAPLRYCSGSPGTGQVAQQKENARELNSPDLGQTLQLGNGLPQANGYSDRQEDQ